jgi:hypothetical protein
VQTIREITIRDWITGYFWDFTTLAAIVVERREGSGYSTLR